MKRLKLISIVSLAMTILAVAVATFNLIRLYHHEKDMMMQTVKECAENAVVLELMSRMQSSAEASESFIRLNAFIEMSQQKDGRMAQIDSVRTSLADLLRFGLDFTDMNRKTNLAVLDSIFRIELDRHELHPAIAAITMADSIRPHHTALWKIDYSPTPSAKPEYAVWVSPMPGKVLSRMWGIVIPFIAVILIMAFFSFYLLRTISRMKTIEQMKDDFAHNMTHELKTPVAVAYSAADSMLRYYDQSDEARNRHLLKIIMQRLSHLSGMIENILSMSMERFKSLHLNIETVPIRPIAEEVAGMMELKADKPVDIKIDIPESLTVRADSLHLGNVLTNLIDNAIKYSNESVNISIKADEDGISIEDDGIGIDGECVPFIFDKFYRVTSGDRYETGGYGLGLFYVKQIVGLMGWSIGVTNKPGKGTRFTIRFNSNEEK